MTLPPHPDTIQAAQPVPGFSAFDRLRRDRLQRLGERARQLDAFTEVWATLDRAGVKVDCDWHQWDAGSVTIEAYVTGSAPTITWRWRLSGDGIGFYSDGGEIAFVAADDAEALAWLTDRINSVRYGD